MKTNENFLQNEENKKKQKSFSETAWKFIAGLITLLIFIVILIVFGYFGAFNWIALKVRLLTGLDMSLVNSLTLVLMAIFFGTPLGGFIWSFFPIPMKNKKIKRFSFLISLAALCFISFFTSKNVYFDPASGEPRMYYSIGIDGKYNLYETDGFDTQTGDKLLPITKEVIKKMNEIEAKKNEVQIDTSIIISSNVEEIQTTPIRKKPKIKKQTSASDSEKISKRTELKKESISKAQPDTITIKVQKIEAIKEVPRGYAISMLKNKNLRELANIFNGNIYYEPPRNPIACKITFQNNSSGTFYICDKNRSIIFKIPPKRKIETILSPDWYYIKSAESRIYHVIKTPNREEFFLEISNSDIPDPGEIFFGSDGDSGTLKTTGG